MFWIIFGLLYMLGWLSSAILLSRAFFRSTQLLCPPGSRECQHGNSRGWCFKHHQLRGPTVEHVVEGSLSALVWPVIALPALVYILAQPRKTKLPNHELIAKMEKELDIS